MVKVHSLGRLKQREIDKIKKNLMKIKIQNGKTVAWDRDKWKPVCVTVTEFHGLWKAQVEGKEDIHWNKMFSFFFYNEII